MRKKTSPPAPAAPGATPAPARRPADELYGHHDPIPAPDAQERATETAWALFQELHDTDKRQFADTVPATAPGRLDSRSLSSTLPGIAPASAARRGEPTLDELLLEARRNNRVCPQPAAWRTLYTLLPGKRQGPNGWEPPLPITGPAWQATGAMAKRLALRDHLEWAAAHGGAASVLAWLRALPEGDWLHVDG
jgi:hypothetical protein